MTPAAAAVSGVYTDAYVDSYTAVPVARSGRYTDAFSDEYADNFTAPFAADTSPAGGYFAAYADRY